MGIAAFASRVSQARNVAELAACLLDDSGDLTGAKMRGLYVFSPERIDVHVRNVPSGALERYERVGRAFDPVFAGVACSHTPCQISFGEMQRLARTNPSLPDAYRAMIDDALAVTPEGQYLGAPLIVNGELAGTINMTRLEETAFSHEGVMTAFAMALHVSTRLAVLRALDAGLDPAWEEVLTRRGREVAELAARGLTTQEIGRALGVSPNTVKKHLRVAYEKLGVATRAELATLISRRAR